MEWWHVYLFTRLNGVNTVFGVMFAISCVLMLITVVTFLIWKTDSEESAGRFSKQSAKVSIPMLIVSTFFLVAVPSQKEAAAIYLFPKIVNSDFTKEASKLPADAMKIIRLKMEEWIDDMEPKKEWIDDMEPKKEK